MGRKNLGGLTRNWVAKRGGYSFEDFVEGEGGSKNTYCPVEFAIHISNVS